MLDTGDRWPPPPVGLAMPPQKLHVLQAQRLQWELRCSGLHHIAHDSNLRSSLLKGRQVTAGVNGSTGAAMAAAAEAAEAADLAAIATALQKPHALQSQRGQCAEACLSWQ
tara:strand:+ start:163 stop:495 length:333 start_codon:yes stop_codon:yes gene_type:complete